MPRRPKQSERIAIRDGYICWYCRADDVILTKDHVIPVSVGGCNHDENIVLACGKCNITKSDQPLTPPYVLPLEVYTHIQMCADMANNHKVYEFMKVMVL